MYLFDGQTGELLRAINNPNPVAGDDFGYALAAMEDKLFVGVRDADVGAQNAGIVYMFDSLTGQLLHTFFNPDPDREDSFGRSLAVVGNKILIGSQHESSTAFNGGEAYLFDSSTGDLLETITNPEPNHNDFFANSLSAIGNKIIIGAKKNDDSGFVDSGSVDLFDISAEFIVPTKDLHLESS